MSNPTPTPWHLHDMEHGIICAPNELAIVNCNDSNYSDETHGANAAFIVRAVNLHQELIGNLKMLLRECSVTLPTYKVQAVEALIARAEQR